MSTAPTRKSHTGRNVAIVVVLLIIIGVIGFSLFNSGGGGGGGIIPTQHTITITSGSIAVNGRAYQSIQFTVPDGVTNVMVQGSFTASGGSGNDIKVYIMTGADFINWQNGHQANAFYNSGQVTTGNINAQLPSSGIYYVVFDNGFSFFSGKTVSVQLNLVYTK